MAVATRGRKPKKLGKSELSKALNGQGERLMHLDLVGAAEAAEILGVERARIGKWRRKGIVLSNGERVDFPAPIRVVTTCAKLRSCVECGTAFALEKRACPKCGSEKSEEITDFTKLAATPLWWAEDIRAFAKRLAKNKPRD